MSTKFKYTEKMMKKLMIICVLLLMSQPLFAGPTYSFTRITSNGSVDLASQFDMTVNDNGGGQVEFIINNNGPLGSTIFGIYFDDGTILGSAFGIDETGGGVDFAQDFNAGSDLPGGNTISPLFVTSQNFQADKVSAASNGIDPGEWLGITFDLLSGKTYAGVLDDLADGTLRVGLHVGRLYPDGESDSFVNNPPSVPAPGAVLLGSIGVSFVGWLRRRRAL